MSSNTYTLKIDIDDSKIRDLEKRIMAIMGMNGTQRSGVGSKMTSASKGGDTMTKNIAKLGIIAIGVGSLVGLVSKISGMMVDSSPMLKQMLKLLNFSVMLILRPIGDFIGFFLKPVIVYMLRKYVIPFYSEMKKPMMQLGGGLGEQFVNDIPGSLVSMTMPEVGRIPEVIAGFETSLTAGAAQVGLWFDDIFATPGKLDFSAVDKWFKDNLSIDNLPTFSWTEFKGLLSKFSLEYLPKVDFTWLTNLLDKFSLEKLPPFSWTYLEAFLGLFGILKVPTFSWIGLTQGLAAMKTKITEFITSLTNYFTNLLDQIPGVGSTKDEKTGTTNLFIDVNGNGVDDVEDLRNMAPWLNDLFAGNGN